MTDTTMSTTTPVTSEEVRLLFFGTFFKENTELTADLIQLKQPVKVTEIRVIPLGATVDLSSGSFQLGATNPSEFDVEFYYNDLQIPTKSTFELLKRFYFNDKSHIQLVCEDASEIITDGLLVRGIYSTVTLAVYGHPVSDVKIKELKEETKKEPVLSPQSSISNSPPPIVVDSPELRIECDDEIPSSAEYNPGVLVPHSISIIEDSPSLKVSSIPTITTRVNYDAVQSSAAEDDDDADESGDHHQQQGDLLNVPEDDPISENSLKDVSELGDSPSVSTIIGTKDVLIIPEVVMDTEEISDGEVFPSDVEDDDEEEDKKDSLIKSKEEETKPELIKSAGSTGFTIIDPLVEVEPISSPPQDQGSDVDDSFMMMDESSEPGFEEIISDEEIDFPEYGEWDENWAHKFSRPFNPFSESFQVFPLKNVILSSGLPTTKGDKSPEECMTFLLKKCRTWSQDQFNPSLSERFVEDIEKLIPFLSSAFCSSTYQQQQNMSPGGNDLLETTLMFWVDIGTNFKLAMEQPSLAFKIRHLKAGIKLVQCLANIEASSISNILMSLQLTMNSDDDEQTTTKPAVRTNSSVQHHLLDLLVLPHMSNSIKLLILRTLDATISTKLGYVTFTSTSSNVSSLSCYQRLIEYSLEPSFSTRMTFSLRSLLNKLRLMEGLEKLETFVGLLVVNNHQEYGKESDSLAVLEQLCATAAHVSEYFSQPLKVLPAKSAVDLPSVSSSGHDPKVSFVRMLKEMRFLQLANVLVSTKEVEVSSKALSPIIELLTVLLTWEAGLIYLSNEGTCTTILIKSLLQLDDDAAGTGCLIAHCMQLMQCVDVLLSKSTTTSNGICSSTDDAMDLQHLQTAMSFLNTSVGREAILTTFAQGNFILPLLHCAWPESSSSQEEEVEEEGARTISSRRRISEMENTVRHGYSIEILDFFIRSCDSVEFLKRHGPTILHLMTSASEAAGDDESNKLFLLKNQPFLKPVLNPTVFTLDGLDNLCETIKAIKPSLLSLRGAENNWGFPGELTTCFRILLNLVQGCEDSDFSRTLLSQTDELRIRLLKHDLAIAKIHYNELLSTVTQILVKIGIDFGQPTLHSHAFVSSVGDALLALLLPVVRVLRKCITQVVRVRKTDFRDTTVVPALLQIYRIMSFFPGTGIGYSKAQEISSDVVGILLAFTIPAVKLGPETEDELNKSTWSAVISEIIKFTLDEPSNFLAGLTLLSEMLPLPLPIASKNELSTETCEEAVRLRRLWSAYIHGLSSQMHEMIGILCTSTNPRLLNVLKRVCIQLGDLSISTCLVVCRSILDIYLASMDVENETTAPTTESSSSQTIQPQSNSVKAWVDTAKTAEERQCTLHTARVLGFLASLMNNCPVIKCGVMHALKGSVKMDEKYCDVLNFMSSILLARPAAGVFSSSHLQAQDNVVTIFQSLCDVEINMHVPMFGKRSKGFEPEFVLACSLPPKEHLIIITSSLVTYLATFREEPNQPTSTSALQVMEGVLRTLEIIAETDYGFNVLSMNFAKNCGLLDKIASSIISCVNNAESFESSLPCILSYLDFVKSITTSRTQQIGSFPLRRSTISSKELHQLFNWNDSSDSKEISSDGVKADDEEKMEIDKDDDDDDDKVGKEDKLSSDIKNQSRKKHSLILTKQVFEEQMKIFQESQQQGNNNSSSLEASDLESALQIVDQLLRQLTGEESTLLQEQKPSNNHEDNNLLVPEGLPEIFNIRPVYVLVDRQVGSSSDHLPVFWLTSIPPAFEVDCENEEADLVSCDLEELSKSHLNGFDISKEIQQNITKASELVPSSSESKDGNQSHHHHHLNYRDYHSGRRQQGMALTLLHRRSNFSNSMRGHHHGGRGMFSRGMSSSGGGRNYDPFRSRPPNTSRPPSLHVDDFVAMESSSGPSPSSRNSPGGGGVGIDPYNNNSRGGRSGGGNRGGGGNMGQDNRNNRNSPGGGNFFHHKRHDSPAPPARSVRGGRIFSTPNSDRWTADSRNITANTSSSSASQSYDRNSSRSGNYDDKYRSSPVGSNRSGSSSSPRTTQPYPQRSASSSGGGGGYREGRQNSNSGSSSNANYQSSRSWRDRQNTKNFNR